MPFYLKILGVEAYGVVGFFLILQNWLNLLDMGLSATLCRQVAFARGQKTGFSKFHNLLKSFEVVFILISLLIVSVVYTQSAWLSTEWLNSNSLDPSKISYCIGIMGLIIAIRFFSTLYRGGIIGFEDQVWLNKAIIAINTLKYIGVFAIFYFLSNSVEQFFEYQLFIAIIEISLLGGRFYYNLPMSETKIGLHRIDWSEFVKVLPFSISVAYTSALQLIISQFDKLLLSGLLSLSEFGYFSIIVAISGGIMTAALPIFTAFQPRLTMLLTSKNFDHMLSLYSDMCQIVTWIVFSTTMLIVVFSREILYVFTGEERVYIWGGEILQWYALASGLYAIGSCQYYLQNAFGNLRSYVNGMTISIILLAPLIYVITNAFGALGASRLLFGFSLLWCIFFTMYIHLKFAPDLHFTWFFKIILPIMSVILFLALAYSEMIKFNTEQSRIIIASRLLLTGITFMLFSALSVSPIRKKLFGKLRLEDR